MVKHKAQDAKIIAAQLPQFRMVPISRVQVIEAAREFRGLPYHRHTTFVQWREIGGQLRPLGSCNCYGLIFLVAERLGLLDGEAFWGAWHRATALCGVAPVLRHYLGAQMQRVSGADVGDMLVFRWREGQVETKDEEEALLRNFHHLAIFAEPSPQPYGRMVHASDVYADFSGSVMEQYISASDWDQLNSIYTWPQFSISEVKKDG